MSGTCSECGRSVAEHDRHVRFTLPDDVLSRGVELDSESVWMSHATPQESMMIDVEGVGAFVRALVPIRLADGYSVTFGVWIEVARTEMHRALDAWFAPSYGTLAIDGNLANELAPWNVLGAPVHIEVVNPDHTPYATSTPDPILSGVIQGTWDHEFVLSALPT